MEPGDGGHNREADPGTRQQARAVDSKKWLGEAGDAGVINARAVIADDGGGIDAQKVRAAALRLGQITIEQADAMSEQELVMLIFLSELSTSSIITDISGRGLGMAIVREKVERLEY